MPRIVALYRFPLKGFTPEPVQSLTILPDSRAADVVRAYGGGRGAVFPRSSPHPTTFRPLDLTVQSKHHMGP